MAEIGAIASVIGLAGAGIKLSKTLYQMGSKAVSAEHNINRIATNVALFSSMLKHFGSVLKDSEALHSPECLATAEQIVRECDLVFEEITNMAVLATGGSPNGKGDATGASTNARKRKLSAALHRVKWYFEQPTVERLIAQLEYLKTTLSVLIQTLNLAAVTANAKALGQLTEKVTLEISNERVHVETLIMARQLSIIILQQYNNVNMRQQVQDENSQEQEVTGRVSPASTEDTVDVDGENNGPKLLTQRANDAVDIVHVGGGNLEFLDRAMDSTNNTFPSTIAPGHNQIIDQLLGRWTRLPQLEEDINLRQQQQELQQPQQQQRPLSTEGSDLMEPFELVSANRDSREQSPVLEKATSVVSLDSSSPPDRVDDRPKDSQPYAPTPTHASNAWLDPALTVSSPDPIHAPNLGAPPRASTPANSALAPAPSPVNSPVMSSSNTAMQVKGIPPPPRASTSRSSTATMSPANVTPYPAASGKSESIYTPAPESSRFLPRLSIDASSSGQPSKAAELLASPAATAQLRAGPSPGSSPNMTSSTMSYYTSSRRSIAEDLPKKPQLKSQTAAQPSPPSSIDTTDESSSDEEGDGSRLNGLGIPWRIRIGQKYFDFLDARLVGPRTPYLPTEPMSWVYSHDNAQTEISGAWVCEEAIQEKKYPYIPLQLSDGGAYGSEGGRSNVEGSIMWRIALPLKFDEVEYLVEKTIKIYREKTSQNTNQEARLAQTVAQPRKLSYTPIKQQQQRTPEWDRSPRSSGEAFGPLDRSLSGSAPGSGAHWGQSNQQGQKYAPPPAQAVPAQQQPKAMGGILSGLAPPPAGAGPPPPHYTLAAPVPPPPGAINFAPMHAPPPLQHAYSDMSVPRYGAPPTAYVLNDSSGAHASSSRDVPFSPSSRWAYPDWNGSNPPREAYYNAPRDQRDNYYNQSYRRDSRDGYLLPGQAQDSSRAKSRDRHSSTRNDENRPRSSRGESRHRHHSSHHKPPKEGTSSRRKAEEKSASGGKLVRGRTVAKLAGLAAMLEGLDGL